MDWRNHSSLFETQKHNKNSVRSDHLCWRWPGSGWMLAEVSELLLQQRTTSDGPWWKRLDRDTGMAGMEAPGSRSCFSSFQVNANPNNSVKVQTYNIRGKTPPITQSSTSKHQSQQEGKPPHGLSSVPIRPLLNMFGTYFIRGSQTNDHCITVSCIYSGMESSSG